MINFTSGVRPYLVLTALCVALFLPGLSALPPTDRDESRFMQATKQMLETGDVVSIRFQDEPRTKKPVGIHWLQYASVKYAALNDTTAVWAYRLPSALGAWLSVLSIFAVGRMMFNTRAGLVAAGLTACTLIMTVEAHLAKTDAMLLLTVVAAHAALFQFYRSGPDQIPPMRVAILFWVSIGTGLLIKGPITLLVVSATIVSLSIADKNTRWLRGLQPEIGIPIAIALVLPWLLASSATGEDNIIIASLTEDFLPKLTGAAEGHGAPPGLHTLLSPLTLWPASLFLLPGAILAWQHRQNPAIRFGLAWAAAAWVMFEITPTKLPHYILPALPGLALAVAGALGISAYQPPRWSTLLWSGTALALTGGVAWATITYGGGTLPAILFAVILALAAMAVWIKPAKRWVIMPATAIGAFTVVVTALLPGLHDLNLTSRVARAVAVHTQQDQPRVALSRYHEPSAVFALGTETRLTDARNTAAHIAADPLALAVVATDQLETIRAVLNESKHALVVLEEIKGFNYSKGRPESLVLVRSQSMIPAQ